MFWKANQDIQGYNNGQANNEERKGGQGESKKARPSEDSERRRKDCGDKDMNGA